MILLSAHKDTVKYPFKLEFKNGIYHGLLDNFIGILCTHLCIATNQSIKDMADKGHIEVFHSDHEEFGLTTDLPKVAKDDIIIVVDVASGPQYKDKDFSLENIYGINKKKIENARDNLKWEGFRFRYKTFDGSDDDEDEMFKWKEKGQQGLSFIIPIEGENWHGEQCTISMEKLLVAVRGLQRFLCYMS